MLRVGGEGYDGVHIVARAWVKGLGQRLLVGSEDKGGRASVRDIGQELAARG